MTIRNYGCFNSHTPRGATSYDAPHLGAYTFQFTHPRAGCDTLLDSNGKLLSQERQAQIQQLIFTLKKSFGIDIFFQKDRNGQVRGYGLVEHSGKIAFDRSKIMKLSELIDFAPRQKRKPSSLDVYRNLFTAEIGRDALKDYVRITMKDGKAFQAPISARQSAWYNGVNSEEKEDVALKIAGTMFAEPILVAYLSQDSNFNPTSRIRTVTSMKQRGGGYAYRITMNDGYTIPAVLMTADENNRFRKLTPGDQPDFLMKLAIHHLKTETAQDLIKRIKDDTHTKLRINSLLLAARTIPRKS